ncbi:hypothetical protein SAMN04487905_10777 [Actinopolyspora xinjiangensis]|uniref:Uncharacterized protein n=1 Tax=Actinopolyspora xinjiangensis TaxID=405564 RepID=A0A1H0UQE8_9ACTN|nr:hypothetical protein SAMN04487905_10777 [Actinopolyspora xinjiangensis]
MSGRNSQPAVSLTRCRWILEEVAHSLAADRMTATECRNPAEAVEALASPLREHGDHAPGGKAPLTNAHSVGSSTREGEIER